MGNETLFSGLIRTRPPDEDAIQRQHRRLTTLLLILWSVLSILLPITVGAFALWHTWQTGQWDSFWSDVFLLQIAFPTVMLLGPTLHITRYLYRGKRAKEWSIQAQHLRQAARDGNEALAPLADKHYEPLTSSSLSTGLQHWGPLKQPPEGKIGWMLVIGIILSLFGGIMSVVLIPGPAPLDPAIRDTGIFGLLMFIAGGGALAWWYWGMQKDIDVLADEWHLEWKRLRWWGRTRTSLDWQDIHTFFTFTYNENSGEKLQVYVLDGHRATLAWVVPAYPKAYERDIHAPFCRLIAAQTHLPLRDLSAAAEELEKQARDTRTQWMMRKARQHDQAALASLPALPRPAQRPSRRIFALVLAPLLGLGLVAGAAGGLALYQGHQYAQYAQMLAQIRAHKPLYYDALTTPDGEWRVHTPTSTDPGSYLFANGSYQLSGGYAMAALAPHRYGDVAIEVTVRLDAGTYADSTDIGLMLHSDDSFNGLVFMVDLYGFWFVGSANGEYQSFSSKDIPPTAKAIQATPGAPNRLDVIMRGNEYICYVNGQIVTVYHDTRKLGGAAPVGIYTEGGTVASFNDFTVYPLA